VTPQIKCDQREGWYVENGDFKGEIEQLNNKMLNEKYR